MSALNWPTGFDRTDPTNRERNNRYEASLRDSIDDLDAELELLGVDDWRLSTDASHQKRNPNYPYADANPEDPSAVVRWTMDGEQYAVACDAYSRLRDNVRTLYLYVREKRKMEQRPVETGESEFANARLPPGEESADPVSVAASEPPHELLGVPRDADPEDVREAFRREVQRAHPDHGGSQAEFRRLKDAREAMLDE
ncbi:J domain-containing protein [Halorussus lipolyticus]|uniref:J domain-containing protein n=1 Tax=Halorussus lipolyticus TaxID=3034024 RepID=UPI0023E7ECF3|nr:J domain-containing protein [Halorussus sp. DT80]